MAAVKNLRFEPISADKIDAIHAIESICQSAPWSKRSFENEITNPQSVFRVAIESGEVVGFAGLWMIVDEAHIINVAVKPEKRRLGIGKRLIEEILRLAKERGSVCATLEVRKSNVGAVELYKGFGFEEVAVRKGYYPDNKEDAIVMWLYNMGEPRS